MYYLFPENDQNISVNIDASETLLVNELDIEELYLENEKNASYCFKSENITKDGKVVLNILQIQIQLERKYI